MHKLTALAAGILLPFASPAAGIIMELAAPGAAPQVAAAYGLGAPQRAGASPFFRCEARPGTDLGALQARLEADPRVVWAEDDPVVSLPDPQSSRGSTIGAVFDPAAAYAANTAVWRQINLPRSLALPGTIRVGIVDTGLSDRQPSLWIRAAASRSFVPGSASPYDLPAGVDSSRNGVVDEAVGHGTMVTGLIAQACPQAQLVIARGADSDGRATAWSLIQSVVFCVEKGSHLINVSLGSSSRITALSDILDWVEARGATLIAPVGNLAQPRALHPAATSGVVGVAGLLSDSRKAPFSSWDSAVSVSAPATGLQTAFWTGRSAVWSGTSFSAPLVTGAIAASGCPGSRLTPSRIFRALKLTSRSIDAINPLYRGKLGGLVNAQALGAELRK